MANMTARVQGKGLRFGSPVIFTHSFANSPTSLAAIEYDIQGPTSTFCVGDVSAGSAIEYGCRLIEEGRADVVLAGGVEALSGPLVGYLGGADIPVRLAVGETVRPGPLTGGQECLPHPVPGEGAGFIVLETAERARARGAEPAAEMLACAMGQEAVAEVVAKFPGQEDVTAFAAPRTYGHTFGASLALDLISALLSEGPDEFLVWQSDNSLAAAVAMRRLK
jgi:hypothetical protein